MTVPLKKENFIIETYISKYKFDLLIWQHILFHISNIIKQRECTQ